MGKCKKISVLILGMVGILGACQSTDPIDGDRSVPIVVPTELPPPAAELYPGRPWTFHGDQVGPTVIALTSVPELCGLPDVLVVTMARDFGAEIRDSDDAIEFVRDPGHRLRDKSAVSFESSTALPADASFTGLLYDDLQVWASRESLDRAIYVVRGTVVERWPRVSELVACS